MRTNKRDMRLHRAQNVDYWTGMVEYTAWVDELTGRYTWSPQWDRYFEQHGRWRLVEIARQSAGQEEPPSLTNYHQSGWAAVVQTWPSSGGWGPALEAEIVGSELGVIKCNSRNRN